MRHRRRACRSGFGADEIDSIIRKQNFVTARTLYNPFYLQSDNLGTCWIARHEMEMPFILINGDTLFEADIVRQLLGSKNDSKITLVTDSKDIYDDDDMKIILEKDHISRIGKTIDRSKVDAESIGMMYFSAKGSSAFIEQLNIMMRADSGLQKWYLSAINAIAHRIRLQPAQLMDCIGVKSTATKIWRLLRKKLRRGKSYRLFYHFYHFDS